MKLIIAIFVAISVCSANHHHHGDYQTIHQDPSNNTHPLQPRQVGLAIASAGVLASMIYQHHITKKLLNQKSIQNLGLAVPGLTHGLSSSSGPLSNNLEDILNATSGSVSNNLQEFFNTSNPVSASGRSDQTKKGQLPAPTATVSYSFTYNQQSGQGSLSSLSGFGNEPPTRPPNNFKRPLPDDKIIILDDTISVSSKTSSSERSIELQIVYPDLTNENYGHFMALARARFPDVRARLPRPSLESTLDLANGLDFPLTLSRQVTNLALIRGIEWTTPGFINSCVIDSFLTYLCVRQMRQPGFSARYFLMGSRAEKSLTEIFRLNRMSYIPTELKNANIKREWVKNLNIRPGADGNYDLVGSEQSRIVLPLEQSSAVVSIYVCVCRSSDNERFKGRSVIRNMFTVLNTDDLNEFSRNSGVIAEPVVLGKNSAFKCSKCNQERNFLFNFVSSSTWYIYFEVIRSTGWDIEQIPDSLRLNEADLPGEVAFFDLGYISYTNRQPGRWRPGVTHMTSLQRHGDHWYYYDDMNQGKLIHIPTTSLNDFIMSRRIHIEAIVYFRR